MMPYPTDILSTRAVIRPGKYVVIPPEGLVNNVIPGIEGCRVSIVASPKYGASFVQYLVEAQPGGGTRRPFGREEGVETFLYIISGRAALAADGQGFDAPAGSFLYAPPGLGLEFWQAGEEPMRAILYKQRYIPAEGVGLPQLCFGHTSQLETVHLDGMENVYMQNFPPAGLAYDMNFHILSFEPGASHSFVETHVQEHGMYILEGEGIYLLDEDWRMIKKGDFVWFGPYCPQAAYATGRERFTYIYSKDCNRDVSI